jgi:hypothetical protein
MLIVADILLFIIENFLALKKPESAAKPGKTSSGIISVLIPARFHPLFP